MKLGVFTQRDGMFPIRITWDKSVTVAYREYILQWCYHTFGDEAQLEWLLLRWL